MNPCPYSYRYILYFVLAVKENKNPIYIGERGDLVNPLDQPIYNLKYRRPILINPDNHPLKNLLNRCGLRTQNFSNQYNNLYYYIPLTNIQHYTYKKMRAVDKRFDNITINDLYNACPYIGEDLLFRALNYLRNTDDTLYNINLII